METQEKTIAVKHKKNGVERKFSETQNKLMGKQNRKMFKVNDPEEAGSDLETVTQETENQRLQRGNDELRALVVQSGNVQQQAPVQPVAKTETELQNEGLRAENNNLKATVTSNISSLETDQAGAGAADDADPNPELSALRAKYEEVTGNKPGRLGQEKMQAAIDAKLAEGGNQ